MQGGADAQLSRVVGRCNCTQTPPMAAACIASPPPLSLARYVHFVLPFLRCRSFFAPLPTNLRATSRFLAPSPSVSRLSLLLPFLLLLLRNPARLITPPFSLHPRSMTSARGNAPQRRLLSFSRSVISLAPSPTLRPSRSRVHPALVSLSFSRSFPRSLSLSLSLSLYLSLDAQFVYNGTGLLIAIDLS